MPVLSRTGASLTAVTVMEATSVAELKAVLPPLVDTSTLVPVVRRCAGLVPSSEGDVAAGGIHSVGNESQQVTAAQEANALALETEPTAVQVRTTIGRVLPGAVPVGGGGDGDSFDGSTVDIGDSIATGAEQHVGNRLPLLVV